MLREAKEFFLFLQDTELVLSKLLELMSSLHSSPTSLSTGFESELELALSPGPVSLCEFRISFSVSAETISSGFHRDIAVLTMVSAPVHEHWLAVHGFGPPLRSFSSSV